MEFIIKGDNCKSFKVQQVAVAARKLALFCCGKRMNFFHIFFLRIVKTSITETYYTILMSTERVVVNYRASLNTGA